MVEIYTIGGYNEVGKNMTAVKIGDDVMVFDAGLYMPSFIDLQEREQEKNTKLSEKHLRIMGVLPDDELLKRSGLHDKVRAFLIGHAHLDHLGAVQYLAPKYRADVVGTPYTMAVLKQLIEDEQNHVPNQMKSIVPNGTYTIRGKKDYQVEFINMTHSTLQTALVALHTPQGVIVYANDYKLDNTPILGDKPNYDALKRLQKEGVKALIIDSLYAGEERKTPSERIARDYLEEILLTINNKDNAIFVTTFSSHIARIKSIVDFGKKTNREIIFLGRSLKKYSLELLV